ncbi:Ankyrin repeat-containing protein [Mycena indigotica]|uniref:Ankyrin repeat-containing protein n=1 Tax=Mycena indigotica TaxID=2126181 RepID=A0A8H6S1J2_9AGAR|nr:Ankyrin repeat-containing protein [Mycena indigotica]KAF7291214.1 Ankyrin repeat-containing protein [Mycena indigotica]
MSVVNVAGGTGGGGGLNGGHGGDGHGPQIYVTGDYTHIHGAANTEFQEDMYLINWISPINFFLRHQAISEIRKKNTGDWLLEHPEFVKWKSTTGSILWCTGIPGMGKTVLASKVVDYFSQLQQLDSEIGVAAVYLNFKETEIQTEKNLVAAIWRQLKINKDILQARDLYNSHREKGTHPSLSEIQKLVSSLSATFRIVYIVVDAMDEYQHGEYHPLLTQFLQFGGNVNLMIMSRPHLVLPSQYSMTMIALQANEEDIKSYVTAEIDQHQTLREFLSEDIDLREEVINKMIIKANGMFLMVQLHIQLLSTVLTVEALEQALDDLPDDLDIGYSRTIEHIKHQPAKQAELAMLALGWVSHARYPLTGSELQTALAMTTKTTQLPSSKQLVRIGYIIKICGGLIIQDKSSDIRLVHYTAQDFLEKIKYAPFSDMHIRITHILCIYLGLVPLTAQRNIDDYYLVQQK